MLKMTQFEDYNTGFVLYINPEYVVSVRPKPSNPAQLTTVSTINGDDFTVEAPLDDVLMLLGVMVKAVVDA